MGNDSADRGMDTRLPTDSVFEASAAGEACRGDRVVAAGCRIDQYEVIEAIGEGGMGAVYRARDTILGRDVALKLIKVASIGRRGVRRFLSEAQMTARLQHSNIVVLYGAGEFDGVPYLALEYVAGQTLRARLAGGPMTVTEALRVAAEAAEAVSAAQRHDVVHCDLKPENLILADDGRVRVLDFGLAQASGHRDSVGVGTPAYMAPEQLAGRPAGPATDIWALMVVLYEMLEGDRPRPPAVTWPASPPPIRPFHRVRPPDELRVLVTRGLAIDPDDRPSVSEVQRGLERVRRSAAQSAASHSVEAISGRDEALAAFERAMSELRIGVGGLLVFEGDASVGKSTLLRALASRARAADVVVARGAADDFDPSPYVAWRGVFLDLLECRCSAGRGEVRQRLLTRLAAQDALLDRLPLLEPVLPIGMRETELTRHLRDEARFEATASFLVELIAALLRGPTMIILDDLQWLDSASWRLVRGVLERLPRMLVLASGRPARERGTPLHRFLVEHTAETTRLAPLGRAQLGAAGVDGGLAATLVPDLEAEARGRLLSLGPEAREVAGVASVIGARLDTATLGELLDAGAASTTLAGLAAVHDAHILVDDGAPDRLRFDNDALRRIAYALLDEARRRSVHEALARLVERRHASSLNAHWGRLAYHWGLAGDHVRMSECAGRAGERAFAAGAWSEAAELLERALEPYPTPPQAHEERERWLGLNESLANAYAGLGDVERRVATVERALHRVGHKVEGGGARLAARGLVSSARWAAGRLSPVMARRTPHGRQIAGLYSQLAVGQYFRNDALGAVGANLRALEAGTSDGPSDVLSRVLAQVGASLGFVGIGPLAARFSHRAVRMAEQLGDRGTEAYAHVVRALYLVSMGRWATAVEHADACQRICDEVGDRFNWGNAQAIQFWAAYYRGRTSAADTAATALLTTAERTGCRQQQSWAYRFGALVALREPGAASALAALADLERARERLSDRIDRTESRPVWGSFAAAYLALERRDDAVRAAESGLALFGDARRPTNHRALEPLTGIAEVYSRASAEAWPDRSPAAWRREAERAITQLERHARTLAVCRPRAALLRGRILVLDGRSAAARKLWLRGLAQAERLEMAHDVGALDAALS